MCASDCVSMSGKVGVCIIHATCVTVCVPGRCGGCMQEVCHGNACTRTDFVLLVACRRRSWFPQLQHTEAFLFGTLLTKRSLVLTAALSLFASSVLKNLTLCLQEVVSGVQLVCLQKGTLCIYVSNTSVLSLIAYIRFI